MRAARAGKRVVLEKPLALDPVEADEIAAEFETRGLTALVFFTRMLIPDTRAWIDATYARPNSRGKTLLRDLAMLFVNLYDANGLTNSFQDRLLSTAQWQRLLGEGGARLLDVGDLLPAICSILK